ncbi:hypothetical protein ZWY2020_022268 [Hordeum vulgare]|nr:hypothetical protein ZWY2020_022268 [Hordeum vulgare]
MIEVKKTASSILADHRRESTFTRCFFILRNVMVSTYKDGVAHAKAVKRTMIGPRSTGTRYPVEFSRFRLSNCRHDAKKVSLHRRRRNTAI